MKSEWQSLRLGDITTWASGGTPSKSKTEYWDGDIPWISARSMDTNRYSTSNLKITKLGLGNGSRLASKGSILLLVRGSILHQKIQVGIATKDVAFNQDVKALKVNDEVIEPWYLLLWFMSKKSELLNLVENTGIGAGKLDTPILQNLIVDLPPKIERERILKIGKALDDKIELNRQTNKTLEAMAQALFKSWFVDFDPVIDNALAAGNPIPEVFAERATLRAAAKNINSQSDSESAINGASNYQDLFPAEFEFTEEMGWVPLGWKAGDLSDVILVKGGFAFKSDDFTTDGYPVIKIKNIKNDRTVDTSEVQFIPNDIALELNNFWLKTGDLMMAMTGATVGKFGLLVANNKTFLLNQRVAKFHPLKNMSNKVWFSYCVLNQKPAYDYIVNVAEGSAQPNISANGIMATPTIKPTNELIVLFDKTVDAYFNSCLKNRAKNETLTKLRDTLLPKLLSGELRIPDAEKLIAEADA